MSGIRPLRLIIDPLIELGRPLPPLAFIPLLIVWFGIGELPKILLIGIGVIPVMVVSVVAALDAVPEEYIEAALSLGASRQYALFHVRVRAALPAVITGLRLSMGLSWTSIVAVEMIAATSGLGYVILEASNYLVTPLIFSGIVAHRRRSPRLGRAATPVTETCSADGLGPYWSDAVSTAWQRRRSRPRPGVREVGTRTSDRVTGNSVPWG